MNNITRIMLFIAALQLTAMQKTNASALDQPRAIESSGLRPFELWYKDEKPGGGLPVLYYSVVSGYSLDPRLNIYQNLKPTITPGEFSPLNPGERFDKVFLRKGAVLPDSLIILSTKAKPAAEDLVYLFVLATDTSLLLRFRPLQPKENAMHRFGPIETGTPSSPKPRWYMFGPQSGPTLLRTGKTESGKSLKDNISDADILSGKIAWGALQKMTYDQLIDYMKKQNLAK